ncbi:uncharacterized protein [Pleurodeles waltl]
MLSDVTTFKEVIVLEGEHVIQLCGLAGLHGSDVTLRWTEQYRISEDKQDGHITVDEFNISLIHKTDTSKEGLHMCTTDTKNKTIHHYTSLRKDISSRLVRKQRDVRSTERQVTTNEDFILAVCLSVIITFICAFCLGFFLRPWIQILCNKMKRDKGAEPAQIYQNKGFSDESFEAEIFETIVSHSRRQILEDKETSESMQSPTEYPQRHASVHFDDDISKRLKETHFSGRHSYKEGNHDMLQRKDPSGSEIYTDVQADLPGKQQELRYGYDTNDIEPPVYANEQFNEQAKSVRPPGIHGASQLDQLSVHGEESIMEDGSIQKLHPGLSLAYSGSAPGTNHSQQHKPNKNTGESDSDEGRQHKLWVGPEYCVNDLPKQISICCQHQDAVIGARSIYGMRDDDWSQELDYSSTDCEIGNMIPDRRRRDDTSGVNIVNETEQQTFDDVVSFQSGETPTSSHGDYDTASSGEKDEISDVVQSTKCGCVFLKYPRFLPHAVLKCGEQEQVGESGWEEQLVMPLGHTSNSNEPIPTICVKAHFEDKVSANKVNVESNNTRTFQNHDPGCESFCFGNSSSDIGYDGSESDEGSSFRFSPSSSFSGSESSRYETSCCRLGSNRRLTEQTADGSPRGSSNMVRTLSPTPQCTVYMPTAERNIDAKQSRTSSNTAGLSNLTADNCGASELDITKSDILTAATIVPGVLYEKQSNLLHSAQNRCHLSIPELSKEAVVSINRQCLKENLEQFYEAELSTQMFNLVTCNDSQVTPLGREKTHACQRSCQNTHMETLPEIYSDASGHTTEDVIRTPRPADFGSNWAGYIFTESMWQSNGADGELHVPARQDVAVIPETSQQAQVVTTSQTHPLEEQDSEESLIHGFPKEILDSQLSQNHLGICAGELQRSTNGCGMGIYSNGTYHYAEDALPSLSIHSKPCFHCTTGVLTKTRESIISVRTTTSKEDKSALSEEWKSLPGSIVKTQHSTDSEETIITEDNQQGCPNESRLLVKNHSVFSAFVSSLQSGNKNVPDK